MNYACIHIRATQNNVCVNFTLEFLQMHHDRIFLILTLILKWFLYQPLLNGTAVYYK